MKGGRDLNKTSKTFVRAKWSGSPDAANPVMQHRRTLRNHSVTSAAAKVAVHFDGMKTCS